MISDLFKKNDRKILIGKNASEEIFKKQLLNKFNIIVFATHGFMTSELSQYPNQDLLSQILEVKTLKMVIYHLVRLSLLTLKQIGFY